LRPQDFAEAEICLGQLAKVMRRTLGRDVAATAGAGAAGGLGFGLVAFAGAKMTPGFELVAQEAGLAARLRRADLVITGEGRIDRSTLMGKGVGELAAHCRKSRVPCVALAGDVKDRKVLAGKFVFVGALTDLTSPPRAQAEAKSWLEKLASHAARQFATHPGQMHRPASALRRA
jgi:glycerate kinase